MAERLDGWWVISRGLLVACYCGVRGWWVVLIGLVYLYQISFHSRMAWLGLCGGHKTSLRWMHRLKTARRCFITLAFRKNLKKVPLSTRDGIAWHDTNLPLPLLYTFILGAWSEAQPSIETWKRIRRRGEEDDMLFTLSPPCLTFT